MSQGDSLTTPISQGLSRQIASGHEDAISFVNDNSITTLRQLPNATTDHKPASALPILSVSKVKFAAYQAAIGFCSSEVTLGDKSNPLNFGSEGKNSLLGLVGTSAEALIIQSRVAVLRGWLFIG